MPSAECSDPGPGRGHGHGDGALTMPESGRCSPRWAHYADAVADEPGAPPRTRAQKMADCLLDLVLRPARPTGRRCRCCSPWSRRWPPTLGGDEPGEIDGHPVPAELVGHCCAPSPAPTHRDPARGAAGAGARALGSGSGARPGRVRLARAWRSGTSPCGREEGNGGSPPANSTDPRALPRRRSTRTDPRAHASPSHAPPLHAATLHACATSHLRGPRDRPAATASPLNAARPNAHAPPLPPRIWPAPDRPPRSPAAPGYDVAVSCRWTSMTGGPRPTGRSRPPATALLARARAMAHAGRLVRTAAAADAGDEASGRPARGRLTAAEDAMTALSAATTAPAGASWAGCSAPPAAADWSNAPDRAHRRGRPVRCWR